MACLRMSSSIYTARRSPGQGAVEGRRSMRHPHGPGKALEALGPLIEKLTELEADALQGRSKPVVTMAAELSAASATMAHAAMALILEQAACAQPSSEP